MPLEAQLRNLVAGELVPSEGGEWVDVLNPATGQLLTQVPDSTEADLNRAVQAAQTAFPAWKKLGPEGRAEVFENLARLLDQHLDELITLEVDDNGMTRRFASAVEVPRGAQNFRSFARAAVGFCRPRDFQNKAARGYVRHQAVGVVGTISPWNLPMLSFTRKVAPALAAGNCVIAKPSEITPVTAYLLSTLVNEAGFPPGVFNVLHGQGPGIGSAICAHPAVSHLSFTGSTATGRHIGLVCAQQFKKPPMLEMGGKNPTIIFEDADMEEMVEGVTRAAFANQGQICLCGSRIYIQRSVYQEVKERLVERARRIIVGDPQDPATEHGASISEQHMNKVLGCIERAQTEGGRILCGGSRRRLEGRCANGYFVEPTYIEGVSNDSLTNQEEIFGPVATLTPFDSEEQAIAMANNSCYGLAASIWTQDEQRAVRVADALDVGMPWINCWNLRVLETPFGGFKNSGNGHREGVPDAMEFFTEKKTVTMPVGVGP